MLDLIGAIFGTAYYATLVGFALSLSRVRAAIALAGFAAAVGWLSLVVALAVLGWLAPGTLGPIPVPLLLFIGLLAVLFGSWAYIAPLRQAVLAIPLPVLIAVHGWRMGGVFFLLLYSEDRLSAPFAPVAGVGDIITGVWALALAAMLAFGFHLRRGWLHLWNAFGALDLVVAVTLGALSVPGTSWHVFTEGPGNSALTTLPWAFVPLLIVPVLLLVHLAIAVRLSGSAQARESVAATGARLAHQRGA
jgi:hypothetical protein